MDTEGHPIVDPGLQKMAARRSTLAERPKFILPEPDERRASSINFSGANVGLRPFSASQALFVHFGAAKMDIRRCRMLPTCGGGRAAAARQDVSTGVRIGWGPLRKQLHAVEA